MRLWIDALTPKQLLFSKAIIDQAPSSIECVLTTRDYSELNQFVKQLEIKHQSIGRHGGGDLKEKLRASIARQSELVSFATKNDFDASFSYISPEAARVSFGLGIPHYICSDSPHSNAPSRLAVPLSESIFCPFVIRKERWTQYGVKSKQVKRYRALDPWAWLKHLKVKTRTKVRGRVLIRLEEWLASYFRQGKGVSDALGRLVTGIKAIGDFEIMLVPRYDDQRAWARKNYGKMAIVPGTTIDAAKEMVRSDLVIGGGATMTQEAALLGVPNISYFPSARLDVFAEYYFPRRLSIEASNPKELLSATFALLRNIEDEKKKFARRAATETKKFEDPVKFVFKELLQ
jgi:uncharacterized protein